MLLVWFFPIVAEGQQNNIATATDGFLSIAKDARAAGQGDIGVATSADVFSQSWNPSKYVFSEKNLEVGVTQILGTGGEFDSFSQLNLTFYNKPNDRSAYAFSVRNYATSINQFVDFGIVQTTHEVDISGSYTLRLSNELAMSVGGRFISLKGKAPLQDSFAGESASNLYGIDVSGFYYGNEMAHSKFNGRWRAGVMFANLRGKSAMDNRDIEIYAPSTMAVGAGFDFVFDANNLLAVTSEYKTLLQSYVENLNGEPLFFGLTGSVMALGLEYVNNEKLIARTGYSQGINRPTDSFASLGAGFRGPWVDVHISFLLGLAREENPVRNNFRISLSLDLGEVFSE